MLGKFVPYMDVPFFWTRHYNKSLQMVGNTATGYSEVIIKGKMKKEKFLAYYINDKDQVVGVAGFNKAKQIMVLSEAIKQNKMPSGSDIKSGKVRVKEIKASLRKTGGGKCKRAGCCKKKNVGFP